MFLFSMFLIVDSIVATTFVNNKNPIILDNNVAYEFDVMSCDKYGSVSARVYSAVQLKDEKLIQW